MNVRTAVVTGGTAGIGRAAAQGLAERGHHVVVVGRNRQRGEAAAAKVGRQARAAVEFAQADLAMLAEARSLGEALLRRHPQVGILVHNLGGMYAERTVTVDGFEATFATNVLAPFALTDALLPGLEAAAPSRLVFVNSDAHRMAQPRLDDLGAEPYRGVDAYAHAKLLQLLLARHLAHGLADRRVSVVAVNPGPAWTEQIAGMKPSMMPPNLRMAWPLIRLVQRLRSPERAAQAVVEAATMPLPRTREPVWVDQSGTVGEVGDAAQDDVLAERVCQVVRQLVHRVDAG